MKLSREERKRRRAHLTDPRGGVPGVIRLRLIEQLIAVWGPFCCWCHRPVIVRRVTPGKIQPDDATLEHLTPRSRGGRHEESNLRVACFECNNARGDKAIP